MQETGILNQAERLAWEEESACYIAFSVFRVPNVLLPCEYWPVLFIIVLVVSQFLVSLSISSLPSLLVLVASEFISQFVNLSLPLLLFPVQQQRGACMARAPPWRRRRPKRRRRRRSGAPTLYTAVGPMALLSCTPSLNAASGRVSYCGKIKKKRKSVCVAIESLYWLSLIHI